MAGTEPACPTAAHHAFKVLDRPAARRLHEGRGELAHLGVDAGQRMEYAIERLDLQLAIVACGLRFVAERVELNRSA